MFGNIKTSRLYFIYLYILFSSSILFIKPYSRLVTYKKETYTLLLLLKDKHRSVAVTDQQSHGKCNKCRCILKVSEFDKIRD